MLESDPQRDYTSQWLDDKTYKLNLTKLTSQTQKLPKFGNLGSEYAWVECGKSKYEDCKSKMKILNKKNLVLVCLFSCSISAPCL